MPYKKQYRKRSYRRKKPSNMVGRLARLGMSYVSPAGAAYRALRLAKKVADAVNVEYKQFQQSASATYDYNGTLYTLNSVAQGDGDGQRDGDSLKMQNLTIRAKLNKATGLGFTQARIIVYFDDSNKTSAVADILDSAYLASGFACLAPKDWDKRFQSKILLDKSFNLHDGQNQLHLEEVIPINKHTQYEAATTTINSGALKMIIISDQTSTNVPTITWVSALSYSDN